ncbi:MAG: energy transducer TonB [Candidatus Obscuribacterales bacterium]|nr:energy transducer TonB [Steroidobacteraceae bacterium]
MRAFTAATLCIALALCTTSQALSADAAATLADWDLAWLRLRKNIWDTQHIAVIFERDLRDRRFSEDLRDYVLTAGNEKGIRAQRADAEKAATLGDQATVDKILIELNQALHLERKRLNDVGEHWVVFNELIARHRVLWQKASSAKVGYQTPPDIVQLETKLVTQLNLGNFYETLAPLYGELMQAYTAERSRLLQGQPKLSGNNDNLIFYPRRTRCAAPATATSSGVLPRLTTNTFPNYPVASKQAYQTGTVMTAILVGIDGCVSRYAISSSSGWPALDDAALEWLETAAFLPGEENGKAAQRYVNLPLVFKLDD